MARDNIMFIPAIVLMVVEACAFTFLVWAWRTAKRKQNEAHSQRTTVAPQLMPMGAVTYAIACSHCKNRGPKGNDKVSADRCHRCRCEIESGFEVDPATFVEWIPVTERLPNAHDSCIVYRKGTFGHFSMLRYTPALGFHFYDSEWGDVTVDNVTHWMPLPEPPKEVE